jgi:hypothetical protein
VAPFDDPPAPVAPPLPAVLVRRLLMVAPRRHDRLDASAGQPGPPGMAVIAPIRKQALRPLAGASGLARVPNRHRVKRPFEKRHCRRGRRLHVCSPRRSPRHRPQPSTSYPCRVSSSRLWPPCFGGDEAPIHQACIPADLLLVVELGQDGPPALEEYAALFPRLQSSPTGTGTALSSGELAPWGTGPQDPQEALQATPLIYTRASTSGRSLGLGQMDADGFPLGVRQSSPRHVSSSFLLGESWRDDTLTGRF